MAERWARSNESGCGLYLDGRAVGFMDTPELAAEIVETMNRVGRLLDEVRREPVGDCARASGHGTRSVGAKRPPKKIFYSSSTSTTAASSDAARRPPLYENGER